MTAGIATIIQAAFNTQLATLSNLPPVQWPNNDYTPVENTLYLRPTLLPASGRLSTLAGSYLHKGFYQIDVFCPLNNGIAALTSTLDALYLLYANNKTLTSNGQNVFINDIVFGKQERLDGWYKGYLEIHYNCYTN